MKFRSLPLLGLVAVMSIGGVSATWEYANGTIEKLTEDFFVSIDSSFIYVPEEMPDEQVTVLERLYAILNKRYTNEKAGVIDSLEYLLEETIIVKWDASSNEPYVGSMDNKMQPQINALFEDVLMESNVSFILKNEDLNGDGYNEIAMYSTSDTLDNRTGNYDGVVCVYVSVFTPIVHNGQVTGYALLCESVRGYCYEIYYSPSDKTGSFSTDEWRSSVGYEYRKNWWGSTTTVELPADAQLNYNSYNQKYNGYDTKPIGNTLSAVLEDDFENLNKK